MNVQNNLLDMAITQARDCSQMVACSGSGPKGWGRGPSITTSNMLLGVSKHTILRQGLLLELDGKSPVLQVAGKILMATEITKSP